MLTKIKNMVTGWQYNLAMTCLWALAAWRGSTKGWWVMMTIGAILGLLHLAMLLASFKKE